QEQRSYLVTQFLLANTNKLQAAGASATGKLGDTVKSTSAEWKDFLEHLGGAIGPVTNVVLRNVNEIIESLKTFVGWIDTGIKALGGLAAGAAFGINTKGPAARTIGPPTPPGFGGSGLPADFWKNNTGGGSQQDTAKKIDDAEKAIVDTL